MAAQGRAIFISYRRDDSEGESGRLFDDLVRAYGDDSVFMDVAGIQPGLDFRKAIDDNVASCGVLLAVLGPTWATVTGSDGALRLDNPNDYVRLEIGSALKRGIPVIPVLVHDAHMPPLDQLPDDLKDLRYRNSVELTHARWNSDVALLVNALKSYVGAQPAHPEETVHATVPVQLPAPQSAPAPASTGKSRMPLFVGLGAVVLIAAVAIGFVVMQHNGGGQQANPDASNTAKTGTTATGTTTPVNTAASTTAPATTTGTPASSAAAPAESPKPPEAAVSAPAVPASGSSPELALIGIWKLDGTNGPKTDNLERLSVLEFGGQLSAHAYGTCPGKPCDWGIRKLTMNGNFAVSEPPWEPRNNEKESNLQRKISVSMAVSGDTLLVTVRNQTIDPSRGHLQSMRDLRFKKAQ